MIPQFSVRARATTSTWRAASGAAVGAPALACDGQGISDEDVYAAPICVPEDPQRIVVLDPSFGLGISLDVGLPVVGAPLDLMSDEALEARAEETGVESIGVTTEPSLERIVALRPDLIVGFTGSDSMAAGIHPMVSQLREIALGDVDPPLWPARMAAYRDFVEAVQLVGLPRSSGVEVL